MDRPNERGASRRNPRVQMSEADSAAVETLRQRSIQEAERRVAELSDPTRLDVKRALNKATAELFTRDPSFRETAKKIVDRIKPAVEGLKTAGGNFENGGFRVPRPREWIYDAPLLDSFIETLERLRLLDKIGVVPFSPFQNPPFARELWWVRSTSSPSGGGLFVDIEHEPERIWGSINYNSDPLLGGSIGFSMFFYLTPDRFPVHGFASGKFEMRPVVDISGVASGWTGLYHPIWHADDKWSKCWQFMRVRASLTTGQILDDTSVLSNLFFLEDEFGVGQANVDLAKVWTPVLRFGADLKDLRARGVSIILETEFRFDYQLEGESDLWLRGRPGSAAESVAGPDNAVVFRVSPGSVHSV